MTVCSSHQTMSPCNFIQNFGALEDSIWTELDFSFNFQIKSGPPVSSLVPTARYAVCYRCSTHHLPTSSHTGGTRVLQHRSSHDRLRRSPRCCRLLPPLSRSPRLVPTACVHASAHSSTGSSLISSQHVVAFCPLTPMHTTSFSSATITAELAPLSPRRCTTPERPPTSQMEAL
jgi:hypothetical protein